MTKTFYVTTPIYYVNDRPHIGHVYTTVVADTIARYRRLMGDDVRFLTGTDEHGQKIERAAEKQGVRPIDLADAVVKNYLDLYPKFEITHDDFIRTTQPRHHAAVEAIFALMKKRGDIYLGAYEGWYCTGCEAFYPENQVSNGRCEQGHPVERTKEESYFFRLSAYGDKLLEHYRRTEETGRPFVRPRTRLNEVRSFVEGGLNDLSISRRTVRWGIPVPGDPNHVIYVWLDALTNYISALGFGGNDPALFKRYWRESPDATVLHLTGKEIVRFHAVYWPAFLMSACLPLPTAIYSHGWWLFDNEKMSKSVGNVVRPGPLLAAVGPDAVRYFMLREMSFGADGTYSHQALIERLNGDLANGLGNLVSRVVALLERETGGRVPEAGAADLPSVRALGDAARASFDAFRSAFDRYAFSEGLAAIFEFVGELNRFLVREEPWKIAKDPARAADVRTVLRACAEGVRSVALWCAPVIPGASRRALAQLGIPGDPRPGDLASWQWDQIPGGAAIVRGEPLFPRADPAETLARIQALEEMSAVSDSGTSKPQGASIPPGASPEPKTEAPTLAPTAAATPAASTPVAGSEQIEIDQFMKIELRTARVEQAERIPKADKLLRLVVDLGAEKRQIVAGIAARYAPEELVGRTIVIVANLKPAKLRGVESQGMLLAADGGEGPVVIGFDRDVPPGTRVR